MMLFRFVSLPVRLLVLALIVGAFGISLVAAEDLIQPDLRLNQVHHFGGDAFYCVDRNMNPTHQYSDFGDGGFRLLNMTGQVQWFIPASLVHERTQESMATGLWTLVDEGAGSYGAFSLWTFLAEEDADVLFLLVGTDEYGKQNSMEFKYCLPVNDAPQEPGEDGCIFNEPLSEVPALVIGSPQQDSIEVDCDDCPPFTSPVDGVCEFDETGTDTIIFEDL